MWNNNMLHAWPYNSHNPQRPRVTIQCTQTINSKASSYQGFLHHQPSHICLPIKKRRKEMIPLNRMNSILLLATLTFILFFCFFLVLNTTACSGTFF